MVWKVLHPCLSKHWHYVEIIHYFDLLYCELDVEAIPLVAQSQHISWTRCRCKSEYGCLNQNFWESVLLSWIMVATAFFSNILWNNQRWKFSRKGEVQYVTEPKYLRTWHARLSQFILYLSVSLSLLDFSLKDFAQSTRKWICLTNADRTVTTDG